MDGDRHRQTFMHTNTHASTKLYRSSPVVAGCMHMHSLDCHFLHSFSHMLPSPQVLLDIELIIVHGVVVEHVIGQRSAVLVSFMQHCEQPGRVLQANKEKGTSCAMRSCTKVIGCLPVLLTYTLHRYMIRCLHGDCECRQLTVWQA